MILSLAQIAYIVLGTTAFIMGSGNALLLLILFALVDTMGPVRRMEGRIRD